DAAERLRECGQRSIAGHAAYIFGIVGVGGVADDVDDHTTAARFHQPIEGPAHVDIAEHFQVPGPAPRGFVDRKQRAAGDGAGVVDENVDCGIVARQPLDVAAVRQVGRDRVDAYVRCAGNGRLDLRQALGAARNDNDIAALGGHDLGGGAADAFGCAGDEGGLACELQVHALSPCDIG